MQSVYAFADNVKFQLADELFSKRHIPENALKAYDMYKKIAEQEPTSVEALWRVSLVCYFVGLRVEKDEGKKEIIFNEGRDFGLAAVKLDPECAPCYFWAAINMALFGETKGVFKTLFTLGTVEDHLKKSLKIDPTYAYAGAYRLLGLIEWKLPGILGGSDDEARVYFEKAIEIAPDEPLNFLFYARLLHEEFDDAKRAVDLAKRGVGVPKPTPERMESLEAIDELNEFIKINEPKTKEQ